MTIMKIVMVDISASVLQRNRAGLATLFAKLIPIPLPTARPPATSFELILLLVLLLLATDIGGEKSAEYDGRTAYSNSDALISALFRALEMESEDDEVVSSPLSSDVKRMMGIVDDEDPPVSLKSKCEREDEEDEDNAGRWRFRSGVSLGDKPISFVDVGSSTDGDR